MWTGLFMTKLTTCDKPKPKPEPNAGGVKIKKFVPDDHLMYKPFNTELFVVIRDTLAELESAKK